MRTETEIRNRIRRLNNILRKGEKELNNYDDEEFIAFGDIKINELTAYQTELYALEWVLGKE